MCSEWPSNTLAPIIAPWRRSCPRTRRRPSHEDGKNDHNARRRGTAIAGVRDGRARAEIAHTGARKNCFEERIDGAAAGETRRADGGCGGAGKDRFVGG